MVVTCNIPISVHVVEGSILDYITQRMWLGLEIVFQWWWGQNMKAVENYKNFIDVILDFLNWHTEYFLINFWRYTMIQEYSGTEGQILKFSLLKYIWAKFHLCDKLYLNSKHQARHENLCP
jgi:hypothetical protein